MTTNSSILIFHRSKNSSQEDLNNQQAFLASHPEIANSAKIIDYMSGDYHPRQEILKLTKSSIVQNLKMSVIFHSFLSQRENDQQYELYRYFKFLKAIDVASLYLMDCDGRLYKPIDRIE